MVAESQLSVMQPLVTVMVLSHFSFLPWYWLNTEKYAFLDKFKAIKSIPYGEKEAQNSRARSTSWKLHMICRTAWNATVGEEMLFTAWKISKLPHAVSSAVVGVSQNN